MQFHTGWIHHTALDVGDIAQTQLTAGTPSNGHGTQLLDRLKLACHAYLHHVQRRNDRTRAFHRVLLTELRQHLVHVQPQLRQAFLRNLDVDFFVLHAKQIDLVDVGHPQELLADVVRRGFHFRLGKAIGFDGINYTVDVSEFIVEERALHTARQGVAHIADFFPDHVPQIGDFGCLGGILDFKNDSGFPGLGITADSVGKRHFLQRTLELVGHLLRHLLRRRARPVSAHYHGAKGEWRVFVLAQLKVRGHAQHHQHHHQIASQSAVFQRPAGQVETCFGGVLHHARLTWLPRPQGRQIWPLRALAFLGTPSPFAPARAHGPRR